MNHIQVEVVEDEDHFLGLKSQWNMLVDQVSSSHHIFLCYEWFDSVWQWRRQEAKLWILLVWRDSTLIGICPFIRSTCRLRGLPLRVVEFLSVPDTQYCDLIAMPGEESLITCTLAGWLKRCSYQWDLVDLRYLPVSAAIDTLVDNLAASGFAQAIGAETRNYYISLEGGWENFYQKRSRRLKKGNNLVANHLTRAGKIELEWVQDFSRKEVALQTAVAMSVSSWKEDKLGALNKTGPYAFIRRLTEYAAHCDWLSIWILWLNGHPLACEYQLKCQNNIYALRSDYDLTQAELSPGTYLNWKIIEALFQTSLTRYYFGPGDNSYKLRWTDSAESLKRRFVYGQSALARLSYFVEEHGIPLLRRLRSFIKVFATSKEIKS
ncbi:cellulose biosynthesis-like protein [Candidatus Nitrosoglobus terrae]|uniref:Cellulose biosynthesis-like protein n=1 Tax=Candidatus Nitrosoglobus terrae TaxID=1630141 RepID=A0A1Q2SN89_9GAMM|nr:GNAT family N-acetyltransferase [Candidatus Nitrosoglobus terrae]BAW80581.1 cellulose biosynthesis-like protein [Candidatus Nitrosoglobus terrae]